MRRGFALARVICRVLVFAALVLAVSVGFARAGDSEMARFLLKGVKVDFAAKRYDAALTKVERVEVEDSDLFEAVYLQAVVLEKREDLF